MKKIIFLFVIVNIISGCSPYAFKITTSKNLPPILDNNPISIFFDDQTLPDSAELIGEISTRIDLYSARSISEDDLNQLLEDSVKSRGANLILLDKKIEYTKSYRYLNGKLYKVKPFENIHKSEDSLKLSWKQNKPDIYEGIYELIFDDNYGRYKELKLRLACLKKDSIHYDLVYLGGYEPIKDQIWFFDMNRIWKKGDIYAYMIKTGDNSVFKTSVASFNKALQKNYFFRYDNGNLRSLYKGNFEIYRKIYPDSSQYEQFIGSLTGYAISNNRIVTCFHGVTEKDTKLFVKGINNDFNKKYEAVLEKSDETNDIAVLKLLDSTVNLGDIPYTLSEEKKEVAEDVFVLSYPMSIVMGEEIKLTNGLISSCSGIAGDETFYQISAPVQPGSSGGPLFDKNGNIIGMVNSGLKNAENVGYALKSNYIKEFLSNSGYKIFLNPKNSLQGKDLSEKVKQIRKFIYLIEVINTEEKNENDSKSNNKKW